MRINPATGLPCHGGIDIMGNPCGAGGSFEKRTSIRLGVDDDDDDFDSSSDSDTDYNSGWIGPLLIVVLLIACYAHYIFEIF